MKTLIVHPKDSTTKFLEGLYKDLPDKTLISGGVNKTELRKKIRLHDRIILCGHGSPMGLLSVGKFPHTYPYIVDNELVSSLRNKVNTLFIWCNADQFVRRHGLTGFHTGMFLSQMSECLSFGVGCTEEDIDESNSAFAEILAQHIDEPPVVFYKRILVEYGQLAKRNPVARYNHSRLFLNRYEPHFFLDKVSQLQ